MFSFVYFFSHFISACFAIFFFIHFLKELKIHETLTACQSKSQTTDSNIQPQLPVKTVPPLPPKPSKVSFVSHQTQSTDICMNFHLHLQHKQHSMNSRDSFMSQDSLSTVSSGARSLQEADALQEHPGEAKRSVTFAIDQEINNLTLHAPNESEIVDESLTAVSSTPVVACFIF